MADIQVWLWKSNYPGGGSIKYVEENQNLGGGIVNTVMHEIPFSNSDLTGQVRSRTGTCSFKVKLNHKDFSGNQEYINIMRFLQARKEAVNEPFYYYHPPENNEPPTTPAGALADTKGRYKVRFFGEIAWTIEQLILHNFTELIFVEDRRPEA